MKLCAGKIMHEMLDGSTISCECIGEPYSSQIVDQQERLLSVLQNARNILRDGGYLYARDIDQTLRELFPNRKSGIAKNW